MATEWYYSKDEQRFGPVSVKELRELTSSGDIEPSDLVWKEGMSDWIPVRNIEALHGQSSGGKKTGTVSHSAPATTRSRPHIQEGVDLARSTMKRGQEILKQRFGDATKQTISQVFATIGQLRRHPIRLSFVTIIFVIASGLALVSVIGAMLFSVFVMGYIACIQRTLDGEKLTLEGFIGFMRHGWDSFWHLFMMLAAFFVTLATILAPFFATFLLLYFLFGTAGAVIGEVASHSSTDREYDRRYRDDPPTRPLPERQPSSERPSKFGQWVSEVIGEIMGLGVRAIVMTIAVVILAPVAAALILFFYLVLEVSRGQPTSSNRFDLVYGAFGKMLVMGHSRWKELLMSGLSISVIATGIVAVAYLLAYLLRTAHLYVLSAWVAAVVVPAAACFFVVYVNVFITMTCLRLEKASLAHEE